MIHASFCGDRGWRGDSGAYSADSAFSGSISPPEGKAAYGRRAKQFKQVFRVLDLRAGGASIIGGIVRVRMKGVSEDKHFGKQKGRHKAKQYSQWYRSF